MCDNKDIVAMATQGIPPEALQDKDIADISVTNRALRIKEQLSEASLAMRTLSAIPIMCTIENVRLEESTKRLLVTFRPDRQREGYDATEVIRTDRTDGWRGESVKRLWDGLEGEHVRIYKLTEETGNSERPRVRVAPYVERLGKAAR
jgi:hypothetical protein